MFSTKELHHFPLWCLKCSIFFPSAVGYGSSWCMIISLLVIPVSHYRTLASLTYSLISKMEERLTAARETIKTAGSKDYLWEVIERRLFVFELSCSPLTLLMNSSLENNQYNVCKCIFSILFPSSISSYKFLKAILGAEKCEYNHQYNQL